MSPLGAPPPTLTAPQGAGTLYVSLPIGDGLERLLSRVGQLGHEAKRLDVGNAASLRFGEGGLSGLLELMSQVLTSEERREGRALITPGPAPALLDLGDVMQLDQLIARARAVWLVELLAERRYATWFQPIVETRAPHRIYGHECLLRGFDRAGGIIPPLKIFGEAKTAGLTNEVDWAARIQSLREAKTQGVPGAFFLNFTPQALNDPEAALRNTVALVNELGIPVDRIVFELTEAEHTLSVAELRDLMSFYRRAGFRVALDDLGAGYASLNLIHQLRPDWLKIDMDLVRDVHLDRYKALITAKLLELSRDLGVRTVAEGVETVEELAWLQKHGADYVQGFYLARPAPKALVKLS
ncbi:MAG: EAL domain-containing protein [Myxococcaceae bacterium]